MINTGYFRGGKRINSRPRKQLRKPKDVRRRPSVPSTLQLNIGSVTANKMCVLSQLATKYNVLVILLQKTHCINADRFVIPNFSLAGSVLSRKHGLATFVHERLYWTLADRSPEKSATEWLCVDVDGVNIVNVYKPPSVFLTSNAIAVFSHPCLCSDEFNCQHTDWGYHFITPDEDGLAD